MQQTDAPSNTAGFTKAVKIAGAATATASGGNYIVVRQNIEGYDVADLMWGTRP